MSKQKNQLYLTTHTELTDQINQIKSIAENKVKKSNEKIDLLTSEKEKLTKEITNDKNVLIELIDETQGLESELIKLKAINESLENQITSKDEKIQQQNETNENLKNDITLKEQKIQESTDENKKTNEQHFFSSVMFTVNSKTADRKVFDHKLSFVNDKTGKTKFVYLKLRPGIKEFHSTVVKLMIESCSKMLSAETTKKDSKIQTRLREGRRSVAALSVCDARIRDCFQISAHVQSESKELFTKILKIIQIFYKINLVNLNRCLLSCDKTPSKCYREDTANQTQNQLKDIVQSHFDGSVERNHNSVKEFKEWLLNVN
jgi:chromosome segregation ATPase